jgi:hypothetical protein
VLKGLDEKATGAAGGIKNHFAELRIDDFHYEADNGTWGVEFAGVAGGIPHLFEHRFVKMAQGVDLVAAGEVNVVDLVDHVAQQIAVDHAADGAFENCGDDVAPVAAVGALKAAQIGEQASAFGPIRTNGFFVIHERDQLVAGYSLRLRGPVAPPVGRIESRTEALAAHLAFLFADLLHIVKEFEEHDPGEHRQAIQIAVEPFILSHNVTAGLDDRRKPLRSGERLRRLRFGGSSHTLQCQISNNLKSQISNGMQISDLRLQNKRVIENISYRLRIFFGLFGNPAQFFQKLFPLLLVRVTILCFFI